ncbi:YciC family protein [Providencia manganoxydans]|uniref:YciC family protein n=1 Tax=Providencia manganoxydans TaxID=2923283 RepID=UPI0032DB3443
MSISANSLISDSINFFKNQLGGLSTIVLLATVVSVIIYSMMIPSAQMISVLVDAQAQFIKAGNSGLQDWVQGLSEEEKSSILRVSFGLILSVTFGSLILICGVLAYIAGLSRGEDMTGTQALLASLPKAPSMFLLLVVCSLLVQLGTTIMVFPGIVLAIGFSLAPAILISENVNPFNAMGKSWKMAYANWRLALPMVLIWIASQWLVTLLMSSMQMNHIVSNGVSFLINNIIAAFALIYFYRLYMLITQK